MILQYNIEVESEKDLDSPEYIQNLIRHAFKEWSIKIKSISFVGKIE